MKSLYKVDTHEIPKVIHVLTEAFKEYVLFAPIIQDEMRRKKMLHELFSISIKMAIQTGSIYATSSEFERVIVFYQEKDSTFSITKLIKSRCLINVFNIMRISKMSGLKKIFNLLHALDDSHKCYTKENNQYIQFLAVLPEHQGKKCASTLLRATLGNFRSRNQGCYIETGDPKNVKIYEKFGYTLIAENQYFANDKRVYCLYHGGNAGI